MLQRPQASTKSSRDLQLGVLTGRAGHAAAEGSSAAAARRAVVHSSQGRAIASQAQLTPGSAAPQTEASKKPSCDAAGGVQVALVVLLLTEAQKQPQPGRAGRAGPQRGPGGAAGRGAGRPGAGGAPGAVRRSRPRDDQGAPHCCRGHSLCGVGREVWPRCYWWTGERAWEMAWCRRSARRWMLQSCRR